MHSTKHIYILFLLFHLWWFYLLSRTTTTKKAKKTMDKLSIFDSFKRRTGFRIQQWSYRVAKLSRTKQRTTHIILFIIIITFIIIIATIVDAIGGARTEITMVTLFKRIIFMISRFLKRYQSSFNLFYNNNSYQFLSISAASHRILSIEVCLFGYHFRRRTSNIDSNLYYHNEHNAQQRHSYHYVDTWMCDRIRKYKFNAQRFV